MITIKQEEVELLAGLLARAGVTRIEVIWANDILDKLRTLAAEQEAQALQQKEPGGDTSVRGE